MLILSVVTEGNVLSSFLINHMMQIAQCPTVSARDRLKTLVPYRKLLTNNMFLPKDTANILR